MGWDKVVRWVKMRWRPDQTRPDKSICFSPLHHKSSLRFHSFSSRCLRRMKLTFCRGTRSPEQPGIHRAHWRPTARSLEGWSRLPALLHTRSSCSGTADLRSILQTPAPSAPGAHQSACGHFCIDFPSSDQLNWKKESPTARVNLSIPSWHHCWHKRHHCQPAALGL